MTPSPEELAKEILRVGQFKKPVTVLQLQALLLEKESDVPLQIMPDGSISTTNAFNEKLAHASELIRLDRLSIRKRCAEVLTIKCPRCCGTGKIGTVRFTLKRRKK